jgi:3-oxoacyl-[acyl-carrier protein] reductase
MERKTAVITGSTQGMGAAAAIRLAQDGFNVVVNSRSEKKYEDGLKVVEKCKTFGAGAICVKADISLAEDCDRLVKTAVDEFGRIDVLVNNAGVYRVAPIQKTTDELFEFHMRNIAFGSFYMIISAVPYMKKQHYGRIVNISSVGGMYGALGSTAYGAAKGAVIAMTKSAAKELAISNITVNCISPGACETEMSKEELSCPERIKEQVKYITLRRFSKPSEIASVVSFLVSDDASYITGHNLEVSGGAIM